MTLQDMFRTLLAFHWHTNARLMDCAAQLDERAYFSNPGFGHGSIHDLLFHLLRTDRSWRLALETGQQQAGIQPDGFSTLEAIRAGFDAEHAAWIELLGRYSDDQLEGDITLTNWRGEPWTFPLWRVLQHLVLHGMQHQAELAQLLTSAGRSPGDIDLLFYRG